MTPEDLEELATQLRRVAKTKKTFHFWMCPKGEDGAPVMLVERKEGPLKKRAREARKSAKVKMAAHGTVFLDKEGELLFRNGGNLEGVKVAKLFRTKLATEEPLKKVAPMLRRARILSDEEFLELERQEGTQAAEGIDRKTGGKSYPELRAAVRELHEEARDDLGNRHPLTRQLAEGLEAANDLYDRSAGASGSDRDTLLQQAVDKLESLLLLKEELDKALVAAWNSEALRVGALYKQAQRALEERHGDDRGAIDGAMKPLLTVRGEVNDLKKSDIAASLDRFEVLEDLCQGILDGDDGDDDEDARLQLDRELDGLDALDQREQLEQEFTVLEGRYNALDEPEEVDDDFDAFALALSTGDLERCAALLAEIRWKLDRAERVKQTRDEIDKATGGGAVDRAKATVLWRAAWQEARDYLTRWRTSVLEDDDIVELPVYDDIVKELSLDKVLSLLPDTEPLDDALLDMISEKSPEEREKARSAAVKELRSLHEQVTTDEQLIALDESDFGHARVHGTLESSIRDLLTLLEAGGDR